MPENDNQKPDPEDLPFAGADIPERGEFTPDSEGLLVALVLAPGTFSRNRHFELFEKPESAEVRRRAQLIRSLLVEMTEPWPNPAAKRHVPVPRIERERRADGFLVVRLEVAEFGYVRTAILTPLEADALDYALHRAGHGALPPETKLRIDAVLARLSNWMSDDE